jgi:hypothetical protein
MQHPRRQRALNVRIVEKFSTRQNFRSEFLRQKSSAAFGWRVAASGAGNTMPRFALPSHTKLRRP